MNNSIDLAFLKNVQEHKKCIIRTNGSKWFEIDECNDAVEESDKKDTEIKDDKLNSYWLEKIEQFTNRVYAKEMEIFINMNSDKNVSSEKACWS